MADGNNKGGTGNVWTHLGAGVGGFVLGAAVGWVANDMDKEAQAKAAAAGKQPAKTGQ